MITIAGVDHATNRPNDLDAQLVATTGCNAAEIAAGIQGSPQAGNLARALAPFLVDPQDVQALTAAIVADGVEAVVPQVRALYAAAPAPTLELLPALQIDPEAPPAPQPQHDAP